MIQCFQSSYKEKGLPKKQWQFVARAADASPKVYVSACLGEFFVSV
jgi:hypothetical protein